MRKTVKQLEEKIQWFVDQLAVEKDKVEELQAELKKSESGLNYAVKRQAELRDEINSLHSVFNAMGFDDAVEINGYSAPPALTPRFAIYQNHLLNQSIKPRKVKK
ncbi:MAG: hypothetical protein GY941_05010 [Planctomycetes bacterium]|nr:hypothetical protein [Planctomycetota bacterium]